MSKKLLPLGAAAAAAFVGSLVVADVSAGSPTPSPAVARAAAMPESYAQVDRPQWFVAVAYGLHAIGMATGYREAAYVGNRARQGAGGIWWAGGEPRVGSQENSVELVQDLEEIFDR